jgi:hypothetical protein
MNCGCGFKFDWNKEPKVGGYVPWGTQGVRIWRLTVYNSKYPLNHTICWYVYQIQLGVE